MSDWDSAAATRATRGAALFSGPPAISSLPSPSPSPSLSLTDELSEPLLVASPDDSIDASSSALIEANAALQTDVLKFHQHVEKLEKLGDLLGGPDDTRALRREISQLIAATEALSRSLSKGFRETAAMKRVGGPRVASVTRNRLQRDFQRQVAVFQTLSRDVMAKIRQFEERPSDDAVQNSQVQVQDGSPSLKIQNAHLQTQEEIDRLLIEERDREFTAIQKSIVTVNDIYKDLASIVDEQRADVDDIESQVNLGHTRAKEGMAQLDRASGHQRAAGRLLRYALAFLVLGGICTTLLFVFKSF